MNLFLTCISVAIITAAAADITNGGAPPDDRVRLTPESVFIYEPGEEWTYSHHPSLAFFQGRFYAMWSNGRKDEDAPGQRVLYATSPDGLRWSEPRPLLGPVRGANSELVLTAAGFHAHAGTLVAYCGKYEYSPEHIEAGTRKPGDAGHMSTGLWALTTRDGEQWSDPMDLRLPVVPNHPPQPTTSGRLILPCNIAFPYTDDPSGLTGWTMTGIYPPDMADTVYDDSEGFWRVKEKQQWPVGVCEGSFYQTGDGVIHMPLRSGTDRLWITESRDDGATWSAPVQTGFSDNVSKFHFGRLPDGRFYYVGNPDPEPRGQRNPLVLSLSRDGIRFDRHFILADQPRDMKNPGLYKGGVYAYPHTLVHGDHLYAIVSVCKESILILRAPLSTLGDTGQPRR